MSKEATGSAMPSGPSMQTEMTPPPGRYPTTYLAQSIRLEEGTSPVLVRALIVLLAGAIAAFCIWSAFAQLDQVARADGQVVPSSLVRAVEHLEGGIVDQVLVQEGDIVDKGQVLVLLSPTLARSELAQLLAREAALAVQMARLRAFVEKKPADFGDYAKTNPNLVREQSAILEAQNRARENQLQVLRRQIAERKVALRTLEQQRRTVEKSLQLVEEETKIREQLAEKSLTPRFKLLDSMRLLNTTQGQILQVDGLIARAEEGIGEIETRLAEVESKLENDALAQIGTISAELVEIRESMARYRDRVARLDVTSPVKGIVQKLDIASVGTVIAPGEAIAEIVPLDDRLVVEVRLSPRDIGFVEDGQPASIRFTAFDYAQFGAVEATVKHISPTTVSDAEGKSFYKVILELSQDYVGEQQGRNLIVPGMVVQADIRTGERTLLSYLARPVTRALSLGFTER